jgi:hypothetical protein
VGGISARGAGSGFRGGDTVEGYDGGFVGCGCPVVHVSILDAVRTNQPKETWKEERLTDQNSSQAL